MWTEGYRNSGARNSRDTVSLTLTCKRDVYEYEDCVLETFIYEMIMNMRTVYWKHKSMRCLWIWGLSTGNINIWDVYEYEDCVLETFIYEMIMNMRTLYWKHSSLRCLWIRGLCTGNRADFWNKIYRWNLNWKVILKR